VKIQMTALSLATLMLAACGNDPQDVAEDQMEVRAEQSAMAAGTEPVALGLTERQLLDADVYGTAGEELGEVQEIVRAGAAGVTGLIVEIEDSSPDRYVELPIDGLTVMRRDDDADISAPMTRADLMAMPEIDITAR
jgi:sporulation protein YlmC with PRC-barrel domain